ncbi:flavin monoamine oxidase family protein [Mongoliitalea lutea]|uniref:Tryptophan 2-monooxygenase n=1 Tax=Mongoliitalea lutea TaxID=849756 RepID=A0A8J3CZE6_9BACT|nr:NAD(P)/FAD-dependent oxidoreductase [Mongoliitalea lutea]GHB39731.1 amine oxidase [Mongoliitalea lutea]
MKRRDFLIQTGIVSLGTGLLCPEVFAQQSMHAKRNEFMDEKVLIIGAGVAGLYAAYILKAKGVDVQLLEATDTYGGRLAKLSGFADYSLDLGAQWLHGKKNLIGEWIKKSSTKIVQDAMSPQYWFKDQLLTKLPKSLDIFQGKQLPDVSYAAFARMKGYGQKYAQIVEGIAGDYGAAADRLSVYYTNKEFETWTSGEQDYRFRETFFDFIDQEIASKVKDNITVNAPVASIDYSGKDIRVMTKDNQVFDAQKVIITVPITILQSGDIQFYPPLPQEKVGAFQKIGMDAGMKVFLKFSKKFYGQYILGGKISAAYIDDSVAKNTQEHVLFAFVMGKQAEYLTNLGTDDAIVRELLVDLDSMYQGQASANFIQAYVQNWSTQPFIRGAYSYSTVGMGNARNLAAVPIENRLFFAGEAMNTNGHHQSVHGAAETGLQAAEAIMYK